MTPSAHGPGERPFNQPLRPRTLQLCAQTFEALSFAFGELTDPILLDLVLDRVEPLQGDAHLLVVVRDPARHGLLATLTALDRVEGHLRMRVAEAIHRSRAPRLSFTVAPEGLSEGDSEGDLDDPFAPEGRR